MKIINDNNYLRIWVDGQSPILFLKFKREFSGFVDALEVYTMMNIKPLRALAATHKELYLLLDLSDAEGHDIEGLIHYFEHNLARRIKGTFRYISVVKFKTQGTYYVNSNSEIRVGVFDTFFEALGTINHLRTNECVIT
jgi:hypothetical protein